MRYNKYHNKKVEVDGIKFDSQKEANRYIELKLLLKAGKIKELELQPRFLLQPRYRKNNKTIRSIEYVADFSYINNKGRKIVEDVKRNKDRRLQIKKENI